MRIKNATKQASLIKLLFYLYREISVLSIRFSYLEKTVKLTPKKRRKLTP